MGDNGGSRKREEVRDFVPANDLEKKLARIGGGKTTFLKGFNFLMNSMVVILEKPAAEDETAEGRPLTLRGRSGEPLLAMFSSGERAVEVVKHHRAYTRAVKIPGWQAVAALPEDRGLIVNPCSKVGFTLLPEELQKMRKRFRLGGG